jgi:hypothetical protein
MRRRERWPATRSDLLLMEQLRQRLEAAEVRRRQQRRNCLQQADEPTLR